MNCKFLVFLRIVFFFFSFFSSACEFRFIERIGAHGKQPDFIIIYYTPFGHLRLVLLCSFPIFLPGILIWFWDT